jgi:hypothetical protein
LQTLRGAFSPTDPDRFHWSETPVVPRCWYWSCVAQALYVILTYELAGCYADSYEASVARGDDRNPVGHLNSRWLAHVLGAWENDEKHPGLGERSVL